MDSATTLAPAAPTAKPRPFSYGWDRTPSSPDEFRDIRESGNLFDMPAPADFTFHDFLQIINPLQHLPVISNIYRSITGEKIHPLARVLGDTLFGGPLGFASAIVNNVVEHFSGKDVGENLLAVISPAADTTPANAALAAAKPAEAAPRRSLGERLAAVFLPDRDTDIPANAAQAAPAAGGTRPSLGERLAAVLLRDREVAPDLAQAPAVASSGLGQRLAAVALPDQTAAPAARPAAPPHSPAADTGSPVVPATPRNGRSLADYLARPIEAPTSTAVVRATLRQPTPMLRSAGPAALAVANPDAAQIDPAPAAQPPAEARAVPAPAAHGVLNDAPANAWFAERMLMGLDLYRNAKRQSAKAQVDRYE